MKTRTANADVIKNICNKMQQAINYNDNGIKDLKLNGVNDIKVSKERIYKYLYPEVISQKNTLETVTRTLNSFMEIYKHYHDRLNKLEEKSPEELLYEMLNYTKTTLSPIIMMDNVALDELTDFLKVQSGIVFRVPEILDASKTIEIQRTYIAGESDLANLAKQIEHTMWLVYDMFITNKVSKDMFSLPIKMNVTIAEDMENLITQCKDIAQIEVTYLMDKRRKER